MLHQVMHIGTGRACTLVILEPKIGLLPAINKLQKYYSGTPASDLLEDVVIRDLDTEHYKGSG